MLALALLAAGMVGEAHAGPTVDAALLERLRKLEASQAAMQKEQAALREQLERLEHSLQRPVIRRPNVISVGSN